MPRSIQITVPSKRTKTLVAKIRRLEGLISLHVQPGVSIVPRGDVISVEVTTPALHALMRLLGELGLGGDPASSAVTSQPLSTVAASQSEAVARDASEATWEEVEQTIGRESNMTANGLLLMAISGALAAVGVSTNALHLVVGAMVIAPGFEPISRIALGAVAGGRGWRRGLADTAKAYLALALAAGATALALRAMGTPPLAGEATYLPAGVLTSYWTTLTGPGLIVTAAASTAGALLLAANRSVLTGGVMIALALIPSAAVTSMALVVGDLDLAGRGLLRWGVEAASVTLFSVLVFLWKRARVHRRKTLA